MNATELFTKAGKPAGIFFCEKCRIVKRTQPEADQCCMPILCACGAECEQYWTKCRECREREDIEREKERFEKAEKVTEWSGPVYCEGLGFNDGYFNNINDLLSDVEEEDVPKYVWTCHERQFCQLEFGRIIESFTDEAYEDWDGEVDGEDDFKAAIEKFNAANAHKVSWTPNYKRAFVLEFSATRKDKPE